MRYTFVKDIRKRRKNEIKSYKDKGYKISSESEPKRMLVAYRETFIKNINANLAPY